MVKPRIFVSSTYYDLKHIRTNLRSFIDSFGYEAVLFEDGNIPYNHHFPLDDSCYSEIMGCHMLVLIIGGRYGSPSSKVENTGSTENVNECQSVTVKEYQTARDKDIPIFIFIERNVDSEYRTYKVNEGNPDINYAHVNNVKVFEFIDQILSQQRNNPVCTFDKFDDIANWLKDQWAGLFAEYLRQRQDKRDLVNISSKIDELSQVSEALKTYTESIMKKVIPDSFEEIIKIEENKYDVFRKNLFFDSKFIESVRGNIRAHGINPDDENIYSTFLKTTSLQEFLANLKLPDAVVNIFMNAAGPINDYAELAYKLKVMNKRIE